MKSKYLRLIVFMSVLGFFSACTNEEYSVPSGKEGLNNDCIKRTLGPNIVGTNIEFAYAMAIPAKTGKLVSAQVEATIAGTPGTYLENRSFYTNGSGVDVGITVGSPSVTTDTKTVVTFTKDTCAATLRYFYNIPEAARGKSVTLKFSATASNGLTASYTMGPYVITKMDMKLDLAATDNKACYISIEDMAIYDAATAAASPGKIDLVYLYRAITGITFNHALASPTASPEYLPGITLPSGLSRSTKMLKTWALNDFNLARLQYGIYIDDIDFQVLNFTNAPNFVINLKAAAGTWVETSDGKYRAYIYINSINNATSSMTVSIKRFQMK
jgi:hypothetical protein